jgi:hypothetical protein
MLRLFVLLATGDIAVSMNQAAPFEYCPVGDSLRSREAMDISPTAVARAGLRCEGLPNVQILCGSLPEMIP